LSTEYVGVKFWYIIQEGNKDKRFRK